MAGPLKASAVWTAQVEKAAKEFALKYAVVLSTTERQLSAAFEIGCLHALLRFYEKQRYKLALQNLTDGVFRYLTTPSGNPANFSYVHLDGPDGHFELRQQVRIRSHVDAAICFTPDMVVTVRNAKINSELDKDYANGKRPFFVVDSSDVVAAHECKSMNPFPELMVSFVGILVIAHDWHQNKALIRRSNRAGHLAPTLFVGGTARALHRKMISQMQEAFGMNIVTGMHEGTWNLNEAKNRLMWGSEHQKIAS